MENIEEYFLIDKDGCIYGLKDLSGNDNDLMGTISAVTNDKIINVANIKIISQSEANR